MVGPTENVRVNSTADIMLNQQYVIAFKVCTRGGGPKILTNIVLDIQQLGRFDNTLLDMQVRKVINFTGNPTCSLIC